MADEPFHDIIYKFMHDAHRRALQESQSDGEEYRERFRDYTKHSHTLEQIRDGAKIEDEDQDQVRELMKKNEDRYVHWDHPSRPTQYALRAHSEELELEGSKPGLDF